MVACATSPAGKSLAHLCSSVEMEALEAEVLWSLR